MVEVTESAKIFAREFAPLLGNSSNRIEVTNTIVQITMAIGTLLVAILAIWGERVSNWLAGPKIAIESYNPRGDLTKWTNGTKVIYYHIKIVNKRSWATAKKARVLLTSISKKSTTGEYVQQPVVVPVQLTWPFPKWTEMLPTIRGEKICDLGYISENNSEFRLSLYIYPHNFKGVIRGNEAMMITLVAVGDNFESEPAKFEISWDGKWHENLDEMRNHLKIEQRAT